MEGRYEESDFPSHYANYFWSAYKGFRKELLILNSANIMNNESSKRDREP